MCVESDVVENESENRIKDATVECFVGHMKFYAEYKRNPIRFIAKRSAAATITSKYELTIGKSHE